MQAGAAEGEAEAADTGEGSSGSRRLYGSIV